PLLARNGATCAVSFRRFLFSSTTSVFQTEQVEPTSDAPSTVLPKADLFPVRLLPSMSIPLFAADLVHLNLTVVGPARSVQRWGGSESWRAYISLKPVASPVKTWNHRRRATWLQEKSLTGQSALSSSSSRGCRVVLPCSAVRGCR